MPIPKPPYDTSEDPEAEEEPTPRRGPISGGAVQIIVALLAVGAILWLSLAAMSFQGH